MKLPKLQAAVAWPAATLLVCAAVASQAASASTSTVSPAVQVGRDLGRVAADRPQTLTVQLKPHNKAAFDEAVEALYDPASPTFHKFFTDAEFAKYAPTAAELKTVEDELVRQGFRVLSTDRQNFSIRVQGSTATAEQAFHTELHTISYRNATFQANISDAHLNGAAGDLIANVAGLERHRVRPQLTIAENPFTHKPLYKQPATKESLGSTLLAEITGTPLSSAAAAVFTTPNAALPVGVYFGTQYDVNYAKNPQLPVYVSYTPKQLQAHYGLSNLIKEGYDGTGQTVALLEAYGYSNAVADANAEFGIFGVPALTSSTFAVVYPEGKPVLANAGYDAEWNVEIALDIQSAHTIAPGARIVEVASAGEDDEDFLDAMTYIVSHKLANTVSDSWEVDAEAFAGPAEVLAFNAVLERAAASGISFQFSSGDSGDGGLGTPFGAPGIPADSPYATAVGGTSVLNNPAGGANIVTGWGDDFDYVDVDGPIDPPNTAEYSFFYAGAGGGESLYFAKPSWQAALPGKGREVPDVSALADPYTGFSIVYSELGPGNTIVQYALPGVGGTSLASPIFTATWAIADQYNGKPLGFAAPAIAKLKPGEITDVLPTSPLNVSDVTGTVYDANGATFYSADALFANAYPGQTQTVFPSALFNVGDGEETVLAFGTDSSLTVTPGWDNVTGYGEPNGLPFIQGVTGKTKGAELPKK